MTHNREDIDAAIGFAARSLNDCTVKSIEPDDAGWWVSVEGMLVPDELPEGDDANTADVKAFLSEPFCVRVLVSHGAVLRHEWIGIDFD